MVPDFQQIGSQPRALQKNELSLFCRFGVAHEERRARSVRNVKNERVVVGVATSDEARARRDELDTRTADDARFPAELGGAEHPRSLGARTM